MNDTNPFQFLLDRGYREDHAGLLAPPGTRAFFKRTEAALCLSNDRSPPICVQVHRPIGGDPALRCDVELRGSHRPDRWVQLLIYGGLTLEVLQGEIEQIEKDLLAAWSAAHCRETKEAPPPPAPEAPRLRSLCGVCQVPMTLCTAQEVPAPIQTLRLPPGWQWERCPQCGCVGWRPPTAAPEAPRVGRWDATGAFWLCNCDESENAHATEWERCNFCHIPRPPREVKP